MRTRGWFVLDEKTILLRVLVLVAGEMSDYVDCTAVQAVTKTSHHRYGMHVNQHGGCTQRYNKPTTDAAPTSRSLYIRT